MDDNNPTYRDYIPQGPAPIPGSHRGAGYYDARTGELLRWDCPCIVSGECHAPDKFKCDGCGFFRPSLRGTRLDGAREERKCGECGASLGSTVGIWQGSTLCAVCAGKRELANMLETGEGTLYLGTMDKRYQGLRVVDAPRDVVNFTGTLRFDVAAWRVSSASAFGRRVTRVDLWFRDSVGGCWHGVHKGGSNTLVRCRRVRRMPRA